MVKARINPLEKEIMENSAHTAQITTNLKPSTHLQAMSEYTVVTKYARYNEKAGRRETWDEMVDRVRDMHLFRYGSRGINDDINWAFEQVRDKKVLPSMRSLQYGGDAIIANDARIYNCAFSLADRPRFFSECLWLLLSGTGTGFSVQKQHVEKLPKLVEYHDATEKEIMTYTIGDTIEGWADALQMLMDSYFAGTPLSNKEIFFDYTRIRRKGSKLRTSGGRAPGPKPLQRALKRIKRVLMAAVDNGQEKLRPIQVYDIITMAADCVLAGGIRKSATIALFSLDDKEMMEAKVGFHQNTKILTDMRKDGSWLTDIGIAWDLDKSSPTPPKKGDKCNVGWFNLYPWRQLSNNSVALLRNECKFEDFNHIIDCAKSYGEPGFVFLDNLDYGYNPCVTKDVMIATSDGYRQVKDLIGKPFTAVVGGQEYPSNGFIQTGIQKTYTIKTKSGREVKATENHKFVTGDGWKPVWDLDIGTKLKIQDHSKRALNIQQGEDYFKGLVLGWFIGDGNTVKRSKGNSSHLRFWGDNMFAKREMAVSCLKSAGLSSGHKHPNCSHNCAVLDDVPYTNVESKMLYELANELDIFADVESKGCGKQISKKLESQNLEIVKGFLQGYFDADGTVNISSKSRFSVRLTSNNISNLKSVQKMLGLFGVDSSIYYERHKERTIPMPDQKGGYKEYHCKATHELIISRSSIKIFADNIGFSCMEPEKQEKLNSIRDKKFFKSDFYDEIIDIEESQTIEEVYDCEVVGAHSFDANGFYAHNCVEIGLNPVDPKTGETGFQTCNLTEINGGAIKSKEDFATAVKAATIIGTLQAGYTYFSYLSEASRNIIRREALLGVSVTGWMDNPKLLLNPKLQREMAKYSIEINKEYAEKIGINQASRVTCTKPAGTTSIVFGTGSGIHPHHARHYFRRVRMNKSEKPLEYFKLHNPKMVESSVSNDYDDIITFCVQVPESAILKKDIDAVDFLKMVKNTYENWVVPGTANPDSSPGLTHNVSNTVTIKADEWDDVARFIYDNRQCFSGISMLADFGDKAYKQAPMERVESEEDMKRWNEMIEYYQPVDWSLFHENDDFTEAQMTVACAGGKCDLG